MNTAAGDDPIQSYWNAYLQWLPAGSQPPARGYTAWSFGNTPELADRLGELVLRRVKTATSSLVCEIESGQQPLPRAGDVSIVLDGAGKPLCILQTVEVTLMPFNQVEAAFAYDEGEGDRTLEYWRQVHWQVYSAACAALNREPAEDMPLCCERFRVLYPPESQAAGRPGGRAGRARRAYTAVYPDPLAVRAGDKLLIGRLDDEYPGWVWCTGPNGKSGWVPQATIESNGAESRARLDYDAQELSVQAGEPLTGYEEVNGWVWVTTPDGRHGWVPVEAASFDS